MNELWSRATQAHREGDLELAEALYAEVMKLATADPESASEDNIETVLSHQARLALDAQNDHVAMRRFRKLLRVQEQRGDSVGTSISCRHIAGIYERKGEPSEALRWAQHALDAAELVWSKEHIAACQHLLGIYYQRSEDSPQAVSFMRKAQAMWEEVGDDNKLYRTTYVLAEIYEFQSEYRAAAREFRRCLKLLASSGDDGVLESASLNVRIAQLCGYQEDWTRTTNHLLAGYVRYRKLDQIDQVKHTAEMFRELRLLAGEHLVWSVVVHLLGKANSEKLRRELMHLAPMPVSVSITATGSELEDSVDARRSTESQVERIEGRVHSPPPQSSARSAQPQRADLKDDFDGSTDLGVGLMGQPSDFDSPEPPTDTELVPVPLVQPVTAARQNNLELEALDTLSIAEGEFPTRIIATQQAEDLPIGHVELSEDSDALPESGGAGHSTVSEPYSAEPSDAELERRFQDSVQQSRVVAADTIPLPVAPVQIAMLHEHSIDTLPALESESEGTGAVLGVSVSAEPVFLRPTPIAQSSDALPEEGHSFEPSAGQSWSEDIMSDGGEPLHGRSLESEGTLPRHRRTDSQSNGRQDTSSEERTQNSVFLPSHTDPVPEGYQEAEYTVDSIRQFKEEMRSSMWMTFLFTLIGVFLALMVGSWII